MASDLRNVGSRIEYCDTFTLYDGEYYDGNALKIKDGAPPLARFHSRDIENFRWERPSMGGMVSSAAQYVGKIETIDDLSMCRPDMYAKSEDGDIFIVDAPVETVNDPASTSMSRRPRRIYRLNLRGVSSK